MTGRRLGTAPQVRSAIEEPAARFVAFGPLLMAYDDRVLAPRPWTAMQSEWAAELSVGLPSGPILELFAGVGHIGLLAAVLTDRPLVQIEANALASSLAAGNAATAGIAHRVQVRHSPVDGALDDDERFALIVADPPYLPSLDVKRFPRDPVVAIDGGRDGLDLVRATLDVLSAHMTPDGACLLQLAGPAQVREVRRLVRGGWPELVVTGSRSVDLERAVALITRS